MSTSYLMSINLCVCRLSRQRGWANTQATVSFVFNPEHGCKKKCRAGNPS